MKMPRRFVLGAVALVSLGLSAKSNAALSGQAVITQWNFPAAVSPNDNSPAPTTGTGTALSLGMTNTYSYAGTAATNSVTADDILSSPGLADASFAEQTWRIRGAYQATGTAPNTGSPSGKGNVNGWNLAAPQYSQGAEFDASTVGYTGITVSFDWYATTTSIRDMQEQYTTDGSTWTNINPLQVAVPNDYGGTSTSPTTTIDFSTIPGVDDNPAFGIRLVSAYDPTYTGTGAPTYTAATLVSGAPVQYNNNSGNWRFGDITFSGTSSVPEPTSAVIIALGSMTLLTRRRRSI